jgi:hypothetical protein
MTTSRVWPGVNAADGIDVKEEYLVRFWPAIAG